MGYCMKGSEDRNKSNGFIHGGQGAVVKSKLTHQGELVYAEATVVLSELIARRYVERRANLLPIFQTCSTVRRDLLQRYADSALDSGMASLADAPKLTPGM